MPTDDPLHTPSDDAPRPHWQGARPEGLFARLAPEPLLAQAAYGLGDALRTAMEPRTLELVALRVSAQLDCAYAFQGHCRIALVCGLSYAEVAAAATAPAAFDDPYDAAVLRAVDELLADGRLTSATRSTLGSDELSVTLAIATYQLFCLVMEGIEPEAGIAPIDGLQSPAHARATYAALADPDAAHADHSEAA